MPSVEEGGDRGGPADGAGEPVDGRGPGLPAGDDPVQQGRLHVARRRRRRAAVVQHHVAGQHAAGDEHARLAVAERVHLGGEVLDQVGLGRPRRVPGQPVEVGARDLALPVGLRDGRDPTRRRHAVGSQDGVERVVPDAVRPGPRVVVAERGLEAPQPPRAEPVRGAGAGRVGPRPGQRGRRRHRAQLRVHAQVRAGVPAVGGVDLARGVGGIGDLRLEGRDERSRQRPAGVVLVDPHVGAVRDRSGQVELPDPAGLGGGPQEPDRAAARRQRGPARRRRGGRCRVGSRSATRVCRR